MAPSSYDGKRLASGLDDNTVRIWDADMGALQTTLEGHTRGVSSVAFSHDLLLSAVRLLSNGGDLPF
jgi:WD40 repeat protein